MLEAGAEAIVHPNVNERIRYGMTHGQVVSYEPNVHNILILPDIWAHIANYNQRIEREPSERKRDHTEYNHSYHLLVHELAVVGGYGYGWNVPDRVGRVN